MVTIHNTKGESMALFTEHTDRVRALSWVCDNDPTKGFITTSHDLTAILWEWDQDIKSSKPHVVFRGHEKGIDSVGVSPRLDRFATGGWDTHLKFWSILSDSEADEPPNKKIKGLTTRVPLHTLKGHKETISAITWPDPYSACTASMDHTIKFWDAEVSTVFFFI